MLFRSIIDLYNGLNRNYHFKIDQKNQDNVDYIIKVIKEKLLNSSFYSKTDIADMLIKHLYCNKKTPHKEVLWKCFGDTIVNNLKKNIPLGSIQCCKCGERHNPSNSKQKYCKMCAKEIDRIKARERMKKIRE